VTYLLELAGEIKDEVSRDLLPSDDSDLLFLIYAVLVLAKGSSVGPEDVHNAWAAWMIHLGKQHESLVPFADLSPSTRAEDDPFVEAIHRVAARRRYS
jgi:hypothetical protein